ncbi:MAG: hypothetical protein WAL67_01135 [Candidatus Cybelea sp.]
MGLDSSPPQTYDTYSLQAHIALQATTGLVDSSAIGVPSWQN